MNRSTLLRTIYGLGCVFALINGAWMLLFPQSWYTNLPAGVPHTGPFNQHFVRDLGVAFIVIAFAFAWSAQNLERSRLVHLAITLFLTGHALVHVLDITSGRLPQNHWWIDLPGVFLPAAIMIALAIPKVRQWLLPSS